MTDYSLNKDVPLTVEQNEVVDFMLKRSSCINASQTGLGKTYSTLTAMVHLLLQHKDLICIIVVPPKALKVFRKEMKSKLKISFTEISKQQMTRSNSRVFLMSYSALKDQTSNLEQIRKNGYKLMLILDEAHILQGEDNTFTTLLRTIRHKFAVTWYLTATPMGNDVWGLYHLMYLVNPNIFGSKEEFASKYFITRKERVKTWNPVIKRYTFPYEDIIVGYKDINQLQNDISDYVILKQKKYNLQFEYHTTDLSDIEIRHYLLASAGMARSTSQKNWAVRCNDLQRVVDNVSEKYSDPDNLSTKERLFITKLLEEVSDHAVVVYVELHETVARIKKLLTLLKAKGHPIGNIYEITGAQDFTERAKVEDKLKRSDVVVITQAGTESINLQKSDTIFLYNIPFSIRVLIQLLGRVTRLDTKYPRQYIHFIEASGTIDTYKRLLISIRGDVINRVFGDIETLPVELTIEDNDIQQKLRNKLLWSFKDDRLPTEEEIKNILNIK